MFFKYILFLCSCIILTNIYADNHMQQIEKAKNALAKVKNYQVECEVSYSPEQPVSKSTFYGEVQKKYLTMKIRFLRHGHDQDITVVFDGNWQWIETTKYQGSEPLSTIVYKLDLKKLTTPDAPFNTGYRISGHGFFIGEDYASTYKTLLQVYDIEKIENTKENTLKVYGKINEEHFRKYAGNDVDESQIKMLISMLKNAIFYISPKSFMLIGYDLQGMQARFSQIKINVDLPTDIFSYTTDKRIYDITNYVLAQEDIEKQTSTSKKRIEQQEIQEIHKAIKHMISLLEQKKLRSFLTYTNRLETMPAELREASDEVLYKSSNGRVDEILVRLKAVQHQTPKIEKDRPYPPSKKAEFTVPGEENLVLHYSEGKWYLIF